MKTPKRLTAEPNPLNPRKITPEKQAVLSRQLAEFGDLGGIVVNKRTGHLIAGHQRHAEFTRAGGEIELTVQHKKPTPTGTIAEGWIVANGERFSYREVDWPEDKAKMAMLAANNHAGEWDDQAVEAMMAELNASGLDTVLTGMTAAAVEKEIEATQAEGDEEGGFKNDETDAIGKEREVYIVPIALTRKEWAIWQTKKEQLGVKKCRDAFMKLIQL